MSELTSLLEQLQDLYEADEDNSLPEKSGKLDLPAVVTTKPDIQEYEPQEYTENNLPGDPDNNEKQLLQDLVLLNNNYISSILAIENEVESNGWSQKRLQDILSLLNSFEEDLYKWGNEHKNDPISNEFKPILFGEFTRGCKFVVEHRDLASAIVIDPEINSEINPEQPKTKEQVIDDIKHGDLEFTPKSLDAKSQKRANDILKKMKQTAEKDKFSISSAILKLDVVQKTIEALAYTNPLTAVAYELYKNVYKPLKGVADENRKQQEARFKQLKDNISNFLSKWNIKPKDLDDYLVSVKNNNNKLLGSKQKKVGGTNAFNLEKWCKQNNISIDDLLLYLNILSKEDVGDLSKERLESITKDLDLFMSTHDVSVSELQNYVTKVTNNGKNPLSDTDGTVGNASIDLLQDTLKEKSISYNDLLRYTKSRTKERGKQETEDKNKKLDYFRREYSIPLQDIIKFIETDKIVEAESDDMIGTISVTNFIKFLKNNHILKVDLKRYLEYAKEHSYSDDESSDMEKRAKNIKSKKILNDIKRKFKLKNKDIDTLIKKLSDSKVDGAEKIGTTTYKQLVSELKTNNLYNTDLLQELIKGESMDETLQLGQRFPLTYLTGKKKSDFKDNKEIIDYIQDKTDYTVVKDNGTELEVMDSEKPNRPHDIIELNECLMQDVSEIGDGIVVFMPSGLQAELTTDGDTVNVDYYTHNDTYTTDEFGNVIRDGIIKFNEPSQKIMEDAKDMDKDLKVIWANEMKRMPVIDTLDGPVYLQPSEDGKYIEYGTITNTGMIVDGSVEYDFDYSLDSNLQNVYDEIIDKYEMYESIETINKLDMIQKKVPFRNRDKQTAVTLMDAAGLGADVEKEAKDLEKKNNKYLTEVSKKTKKAVTDKRFTDFVNSEDEDTEKACKKLIKNIKLNKGKKEQMSDVSKALEELQEVLTEFNLDEEDMNEISDEKAYGSNDKRFEKRLETDAIKKEKIANYKDIRDRFNAGDPEVDEEDVEEAKEEVEEATEEAEEAAVAHDKNCELNIDREFRKAKNEDVGGLTDIQDLDLPQALADTIEVTPEGTVMTLETVYAEVQALKNELTSAIQSIKDLVKAEMEALKNDIKTAEEVEVLQNIDDKVDELSSEMAAEQEPTEDVEEEATEEQVESEEDENDQNVENVEESYEGSKLFESFLVTGAIDTLKQQKINEDLNAVKSEIDKATKEGKSAEEIKNLIDLNSENDDENKKAKDYAAEKLSESSKLLDTLRDTARTSALEKLRLG